MDGASPKKIEIPIRNRSKLESNPIVTAWLNQRANKRRLPDFSGANDGDDDRRRFVSLSFDDGDESLVALAILRQTEALRHVHRRLDAESLEANDEEEFKLNEGIPVDFFFGSQPVLSPAVSHRFRNGTSVQTCSPFSRGPGQLAKHDAASPFFPPRHPF